MGAVQSTHEDLLERNSYLISVILFCDIKLPASMRYKYTPEAKSLASNETMWLPDVYLALFARVATFWPNTLYTLRVTLAVLAKLNLMFVVGLNGFG